MAKNYIDDQLQFARELSAEQGLIPMEIAFPPIPKVEAKEEQLPESVLDAQLLEDLSLEQSERSV